MEYGGIMSNILEMSQQRDYKFEFIHPCLSQITVPPSNVFYMTFLCYACFMHCLCLNADTCTGVFSKSIGRGKQGAWQKVTPNLQMNCLARIQSVVKKLNTLSNSMGHIKKKRREELFLLMWERKVG